MLSSKKWATLCYDTETINRATKHICILSLGVQKQLPENPFIHTPFPILLMTLLMITFHWQSMFPIGLFILYLFVFCLEKRENIFFWQKLLFAFTAQICNKMAFTQHVGLLIQEVNTMLVQSYVFIQISGSADPYSWRISCVPVIPGAVLLEGTVPGKVSKIKLDAQEWLDKERFGESCESQSTEPVTRLPRKGFLPEPNLGEEPGGVLLRAGPLLNGAHLSMTDMVFWNR